MAICSNCGKRIWFGKDKIVAGQVVCQECEPIVIARLQEGDKEIRKRDKEIRKRRDDIIAVTVPTIEGYKIKEYLGFVSARAVLGVNIFRDLFAGVRDVFGGRSGALQDEFRRAESSALEELKEETAQLGGNAVIGVSMDYEMIETTSGGKMIMVTATGTAVKVEPKQE